jgi:flagellar basal-body rod protein FlgC
MIASVPNIVSSSLNNASKTLEVSASNVANLSTTGQVSGNQENGKAYIARRVESSSQVEGGVRTQVKDKSPGTVPVPDGEGGITNAPNVNLAEEIVTQQFASYQFDASLKVLETNDELTGSLLDIQA